jgi:hypothetical protein
MSPARRFRVTIMLMRTKTLELDTASPEAAEAIALYLHENHGDQDFFSSDEDLVDVLVHDDAEASS